MKSVVVLKLFSIHSQSAVALVLRLKGHCHGNLLYSGQLCADITA